MSGALARTCEETAVTGFNLAVTALTVSDCECATMTCEASGAAFVAVSLMAVFVGLWL